MTELAHSRFLDLTAWRQTSATTVAEAYGFDPSTASTLDSGETVTVGLMLDRANDPTALLRQDWASRQTALAGMQADGTLWSTYGADQTTYDGVTAALRNHGIGILDGSGGWTGSAESRTIWVTLTASDFRWLFGTELKTATDRDGYGLTYWDGNLSIDHAWGRAISGLSMEFGYAPDRDAVSAGTHLPQGQQSPGNSLGTFEESDAASHLYPDRIADLYDFPLSGLAAPTSTIGLLEPGIGIRLPHEGDLDAQALLHEFKQRIDQYRSGNGLAPLDELYFLSKGGSYSGDAAGERSLDVGVATSAAPNSKLGIYGGPSDAYSILVTYLAAIWDRTNDPAVLSTSWSDTRQAAPGSPFQRMVDEAYIDAALRNISFVASAGDGGSGGEDANGVPNTQWGQASPYAVVVGGTSITLAGSAAQDETLAQLTAKAGRSDPATLKQLVAGGLKILPTDAASGSLLVETVWNQYTLSQQTLSPGYTENWAGAGGIDPRVPMPGYQSDYGLALTGAGPHADTGRGVPDVSAVAGGNLEYIVPNDNMEGTSLSGGTSAAAPLWAALTAQISTVFDDQGLPTLGYYNDLLYTAAALAPGAFNDITIGNNVSSYVSGGRLTDEDGGAITPTGYGYQAGPDYDLTTGLGTPNGLLLARALTAIAHAQMSSDAPDLLDQAGFASDAAQHLLVQATLQQDQDFGLAVAGTSTSYAGTAAGSLAWSSAFAQKAMQADFDPALVRLFDGGAQGSAHDLSVADGASLAVTLGGSTVAASRAAMTSPFGFVDYKDTAGNGLRLARAVAVAQTAGGADDQQAVVRLRQNTEEAVSASFYRVDDLDGTIDGLAPGQAGYAAAVTGRLYATENGTTAISGPGDGYYKQVRLAGIDGGDLVAMTLTSGGHDFYGFSAANESAGGSPVTHLWNYGLNTWGWESTSGGGDRDYNDLVVQLDFTSASGSGWLVQDTATGGDGDDVMYGNDEANRLTAGSGADTIQGAGGRDTLFGHLGDDLVLGQDGDDFLGTGAGNDFGSGGFGHDEVHGEGGDDLLFGDDGNDGVYGGEGKDLVYGGTGHDHLTGDAGEDQLYGQDGDDRLFGGEGGDNLSGGAGADTIEGGAGSDLLFGNSGDDVLTGGAGADIFAFGPGDGLDRILDFVTGGSEADVISFNGGAFADFAALLAASRQDGSDVVIAYGAGDALTLAGVQLASLSAANVTFA